LKKDASIFGINIVLSGGRGDDGWWSFTLKGVTHKHTHTHTNGTHCTTDISYV